MDPVAKKLGVEKFPAVVGLLSNGEQLHPDDKALFDKPTPKCVGALRTFLEKLKKKDDEYGDPKEGPQPVTFLTQTNMKKLCGPDSALCIIAILKSSEDETKAKQILNEVRFLMTLSHAKLNLVPYFEALLPLLIIIELDCNEVDLYLKARTKTRKMHR